MVQKDEALKQISEFETHYRYDGTYLRELLTTSPEGYDRFSNFMPMARHREKLGLDEYWVAKLATMQVADCGECLQLNVRMALEAGVPKELVEAVVRGGHALPERLRDVYRYARNVAGHDAVAADLMDQMIARYDKGSLLEFGLCIAAAKVFPTIKRAVGHAKSCRVIEIEM